MLCIAVFPSVYSHNPVPIGRVEEISSLYLKTGLLCRVLDTSEFTITLSFDAMYLNSAARRGSLNSWKCESVKAKICYCNIKSERMRNRTELMSGMFLANMSLFDYLIGQNFISY